MQVVCAGSGELKPGEDALCEFDEGAVLVPADFEPEAQEYRCQAPEGLSSLRHRLITGNRPGLQLSQRCGGSWGTPPSSQL